MSLLVTSVRTAVLLLVCVVMAGGPTASKSDQSLAVIAVATVGGFVLLSRILDELRIIRATLSRRE